jgi:hypothetical protein
MVFLLPGRVRLLSGEAHGQETKILINLRFLKYNFYQELFNNYLTGKSSAIRQVRPNCGA